MIQLSTNPLWKQGIERETHLSTECTQAVKEAWLSPTDVYAGGPQYHQFPAASGKAETVGLIRSVRGHTAFSELHHSGIRKSSGAIWITFNANATAHPRIAFAVGRRFGPAVARNRVRRQLRACLDEIFRSDPELFAPGDYLVGVRVEAMGKERRLETAEAHQWLTRILRKLEAS